MMRTWIARSGATAPLLLTIVLSLAPGAGCNSNTEKVGKAESSYQKETNPSSTPVSTPPSGSTVTMQGLQWDLPAGLRQETPANTMRIAQYRLLSGEPGVKDGELAVFFFGVGSGGGTSANLERWANQFKQDDGADPMKRARTESFTTRSGLKVTAIELSGRYQSGGMGMGGPSYDEPGWRLFGAVVEGTGGPWFFKAVGPDAVIDKNRNGLLGLYKGLRTAAS